MKLRAFCRKIAAYAAGHVYRVVLTAVVAIAAVVGALLAYVCVQQGVIDDNDAIVELPFETNSATNEPSSAAVTATAERAEPAE